MFTEEVLAHLSYECECPLDIKEDLGIVNGVCPKHPKNVLLFDGITIEAYKKNLIENRKKLDRKHSAVV